MGTKYLFISLLVGISCLVMGGESGKLPECGSNFIRCGDRSCISKELLCDGANDCPRGEDERSCGENEQINLSSSCAPGYFECYTGECIYDSWVCDGYADCMGGEDEFFCYSTSEDPWYTSPRPPTSYSPWYTTPSYSTHYPWYTTPGPSSYPPWHTTADPTPAPCHEPFDMISGRCVMVEPFLEANWEEARYLCEKFESDLVVLDSVMLFQGLVQFINNKGLDSHSYWIGASDLDEEGKWMWLSGENVTMGTPFWATYGSTSTIYQEPRDEYKDQQDCAYLDSSRFLYIDDAECSDDKAVICQKPTWLQSELDVFKIKEISQERLQSIIERAEKKHQLYHVEDYDTE